MKCQWFHTGFETEIITVAGRVCTVLPKIQICFTANCLWKCLRLAFVLVNLIWLWTCFMTIEHYFLFWYLSMVFQDRYTLPGVNPAETNTWRGRTLLVMIIKWYGVITFEISGNVRKGWIFPIITSSLHIYFDGRV